MANVNRPNGANPVRAKGSPWMGPGNLYWIPQADTNAYYPGDFVCSGSTGSSAGSLGLPAGIPQASIAAGNASTLMRGIITSVYRDPNNLTSQYVPATKAYDYYVYVCDDPSVVFEMTDDGLTSGNLNASTVGQNCDFTKTAPTAPQFQSANVILSSSINTTNTLPIKIIGLTLTPNNLAGVYARWLCVFNKHELSGASTTGV